MPNESVPNIDQDGAAPMASARVEDIELRLLDANAKSKENVNKEADQRYRLRWLAVVVSILLICGMGLILWHASHKVLGLSYVHSQGVYIIAAFVAPIVSMTTLSLALLVAAFRGFKDSDAKDGGGVAMSAAKTGGVLD